LLAAVATALGVAVLAGCGDSGATKADPPTTHADPAPPPQKGSQPHGRLPSYAAIRVRVVDGDTAIWLRHPRVRTRGAKAVAAGRGALQRLEVPRRGRFSVTASAHGYPPRTVVFPRRPRKLVWLRLYRPSSQWLMYGVTPERTQAHSRIALRPPFRIVWSRGLGSMIEYPAVVADGVAYVTSFRGMLWALDMRSGKSRWRFYLGHDEQDSSPTIAGRDLVVHSKGGTVFVFDRATGRLRWRYNVGSYIESTPLVRRGIDYFGTWGGSVYALDLRRHRVRWSYRSGAKITAGAALLGRTLYIGDYAGRALALSATTGRLRWSRSVNGRIYATPAVAAGRVFVPSSDGNSLTAFSTSGRQVWRFQTGGYVYSSPAVWAGRVYIGSYNGVFYCLSARNGSVLWSVPTGGAISGAAAVIDGVAYAGSFSGRIYGVDARTGRVRMRFPDGEYVPVSGNAGTLLLHGFSRIYAVVPRRR
jgi:outer membrane protein assembly factor BamB